MISTLKKHNGLTLSELLVSSVLVGIVMVGIASFSVSLKNIQSSSNYSTLLSISATAAISDLRRSASLATGDRTDPGIVIGTSSGDNYAAFRRDLNITPTNYADDTWFIYIADIADDQLIVCEQTEGQGGSTPNRTGAGQCRDNSSLQLTNKLVNANFNLVTPDTTPTEFYIDITIDSRHDPSQAVHPVSNPEYIISTRITPLGHSW